ncbi:MAG: hypothetical protein K0R39_3962 [Symbiobacteriaceae bacterium]|jgi:predicted small lipoprotein YifL|nr:hypothetical protein [Symbiobacteriaceae bacterium]
MRKIVGWSLVLLLMAVSLAGCGSKTAKPAPVQAPSTSAPPTSSNGSTPGKAPGTIPGDQAALQAALAEKSAVRYEIVVADDTGGRDQDAYLDWLTAQKKWPEASSLVLVVYAKENYDLRFAMGATFFEKKVTVDEMLTLMRSSYFPKGSKGDPAGGLAELIRAVNQRLAK